MQEPIISVARPVLLGSGSPRRREILSGLLLPFWVSPPDVDESGRAGDTPDSFLERVVADKLEAVLAAPERDYCVALVADTVVLIDDRILGKPADTAGAFELLTLLAGRRHTVKTRYALSLAGGETLARTVTSEVTLRAASPAELRSYAASGEGLDKAGAYAVQGLGSFLVQRVSGSYTNVVGFPACELIQDLKGLGVLPQFPL